MSFAMPSALSTATQSETASERRHRKELSIEKLCGAVHLFGRWDFADEWGSERTGFLVLSVNEAMAFAKRVHGRVFAHLVDSHGGA
jgi:hypothetical protein